MIYSGARRSRGKLRWKPVFILTCNSLVGVWSRGERLIESPGSWFPSKFPSGKLKPKLLGKGETAFSTHPDWWVTGRMPFTLGLDPVLGGVPHSQNLSDDEQCRKGTAPWKATFYSYLQTAKPKGQLCQKVANPETLCSSREGSWFLRVRNLSLERTSPGREVAHQSSLGLLRAFTGKQYRRCGVV